MGQANVLSFLGPKAGYLGKNQPNKIFLAVSKEELMRGKDFEGPVTCSQQPTRQKSSGGRMTRHRLETRGYCNWGNIHFYKGLDQIT